MTVLDVAAENKIPRFYKRFVQAKTRAKLEAVVAEYRLRSGRQQQAAKQWQHHVLCYACNAYMEGEAHNRQDGLMA